MASRIKEYMLLMNVEYVLSDTIGGLPTSWEIMTKIHVNELSPKTLWENYIKIKNSTFLVLLSYQKEAAKIQGLKNNDKTETYTGKLTEMIINDQSQILLEMPHKPDAANLSFRINSLFIPFLNKNVKITIDEINILE